MNFLEEKNLKTGSWQSFERSICRLLLCEGYQNVRLIGGSGDKGADVIATKYNKRWLFQAKQWKKPIGIEVVQETLSALAAYEADIPVIVASHGFESAVYEYRKTLMSQGINLQLWSAETMVSHFKKLTDVTINSKKPREYQEEAIVSIVQAFSNERKALIVLATGLGKTFVAAEAFRRLNVFTPLHTLVLAHTNSLVYQLEKAFWPFLKPTQSTRVWNGIERLSENDVMKTDMVFACVDTVYEAIKRGDSLSFDAVIVDECHHAGSPTYSYVLEKLSAGTSECFLLGLTATPWRPDEQDIKELFGEPRIQIDMVYGMKHGYLTNVDYRMHTDNVDWDALKSLTGKSFSPNQINKTLFINQWDDAVIDEFRKAWSEQPNPRAIVFCGTIEHAEIMRDKINSLSFCYAASIHSKMEMAERNLVLSDFSDGKINVICTVDVFNEGIDVPDVNILVFQRVTHSRRIFIQQLGRGLRISEEKEKVIVLDFVSDVRRFAAGLDLKNRLTSKQSVRVNLPNKVTFKRHGTEDKESETFLRQWLDDVASIENAGDNESLLKFPPRL